MTGIELIAAERIRQVEEEGYDAEHDDGHTGGEFARAAAAYAMAPTRLYVKNGNQRQTMFTEVFPPHWRDKSRELTTTEKEPGRAPWERVTDRIGLLAKAGALIAAEIDRVQRLEGETP